jgi:hypothetical protein
MIGIYVRMGRMNLDETNGDMFFVKKNNNHLMSTPDASIFSPRMTLLPFPFFTTSYRVYSSFNFSFSPKYRDTYTQPDARRQDADAQLST